MASTKIFSVDITSDSTITMTNEDTSNPASRITDDNVSIVTKSTAVGTKITFNFGTATTIAGMAYFNTNMVSGDTTFTWTFGNDSTQYISSDINEVITQQYLSEGEYEICLIVIENLIETNFMF